MRTIQDIQREISIWSRRLQKLKEKKATLGNSADPSIDTEIEDIETTMEELKIELNPYNADNLRPVSTSIEMQPTHNPTKQYKLHKIRALLTQGFTAEELRRFCFDTPEFRCVYDQLSETTGKSRLVDYLIEYADRHLLMENLLSSLKAHNPSMYGRYQPYF